MINLSPLPTQPNSRHNTLRRLAISTTIIIGLAACGGGSTSGAGAPAGSAANAPASGSGGIATGALPAGVVAQPTFHMAAITPPPPSDVDVGGTNASSRQPPVTIALSADAAAIDTARLTPEALTTQLQSLAAARHAGGITPNQRIAISANGNITPQSTAVYTPAQIRAAYGLPPLPAAGTALSATDAAALGAGQTIYIVDANDNPNAFPDLNTFSASFGLPSCTRLVLTAATPLPLAAPPAGCQLVLAYPNASGTANNSAPAYDAGWASEIALDVEWSHAIAPLARIVLLEAASASLGDLLGGVSLANKMGPGALSMSFGAGEGSWVSSVDSAFTASGMTYLASTGDSGAGVSWPAVSNNVLAVGGTSLNYPGSGSRSEAAWAGSGGGISAYEGIPSYQNGVSIAGGGILHSRAVADVSFNADPNTGQYVVITPPGGGAGWYVYGGTSISSPQWAGVIALINANRVLNGQALLGDVHAALYAQVAAVPGNYATAFDDITTGADGSCATCAAAAGYDQSTGWGTPNYASLLSLLSSVQNLPPLPAATMPGGIAGIAYATSWAATDAAHNPLTYTLTGAPAGLAVSASGAVSWAHPLAGVYRFGVTVKNAAGKTATGTESLTIVAAPAAPTVPGATFLVKTGTALSRSLGVTVPANSGTISYTLSGAPAGLTVTAAGVLTWASAVAGHYVVTATATNAYGASGSGVYNFTVIAEAPPVFSGSTSLNGVAGSPFSTTLGVSDPNGGTITLAMSGAPAGLTLGNGGLLSWAQPVAGAYTLVVTATDSYGYSASATYKLAIEGAPVVSAATLTANTGAAFSAQVVARDPIGAMLTYSLSGAPAGLGIGTTGVLAWAAPVRGSYAFTVTARNPAGQSASATIKLTVYGQPVVTSGVITGTTAAPLNAAIKATDPNGSALTYSLSGGPAGMAISSTGMLTWTTPVRGSYAVTVTARDALGATGSGSFAIAIYGTPVVSTAALGATAGAALHANVTASDPNGSPLTFSLSDGPSGLAISSSGALTWAAAVKGVYVLTISANDALGASGSAKVTLTVS